MKGLVFNILKRGGLALLALALISCTTKEDKTATIQFDFTSQGKSVRGKQASQSAKLIFMALNITGPGMEPILKNWNRPPTAIEEFEVPVGPERLFQYLAVYRDTDVDGLSFHYADAKQALVSGSNTVTLYPAAVGGSNVKEADFGGRFLEGSNKGPTGIVKAYLQPRDLSKPKMWLFDEEIFGGYFNFFTIDDADYGFTWTLLPIVVPKIL